MTGTIADVAPLAYPWECQEDEGSRPFAMFVRYRDMDTLDRSLAKVAKIKGSANLRQLAEWSSKYRWVERARAWDQEQDRIRRQEHLDELAAMSRRHGQQAEATLRALLAPAQAFLRTLQENPQALDNLSPVQKLDLAIKAARFVPQLVQIERLAKGESTERVEVRRMGQAPGQAPEDDLGFASLAMQAMIEARLVPPPATDDE